MDEEIIARWNKFVAPGDTVYHLGDVALGQIADSLPKVARLNGFKVLVVGNHDRIFSAYSQNHIARFMPEYARVFQEIVPEAGMVVTVGGSQVRLSHFPYAGDSQGKDRYVDERPPDEGMPLVHGHTHGQERLTRTVKGTAQVHVGQDAWDFSPVPESAIEALLRAKP